MVFLPFQLGDRQEMIYLTHTHPKCERGRRSTSPSLTLRVGVGQTSLAGRLTDSQQRTLKLTRPCKYNRTVGFLAGERRPIPFGTEGCGRRLEESSGWIVRKGG